MALITCQDLSLGYDGREIIHTLNFTVNVNFLHPLLFFVSLPSFLVF